MADRVAGSGRPGFEGDGEEAETARLDGPTSVAVDRQGNVYIADSGNGRVRRVTPDGRITTVAGTGAAGSPDGSIATEVSMVPVGIAVDRAGTLYVADLEHHRVLAVQRDGRVDVVAGTGVRGFSGDGGPARAALLDSPKDVDVSLTGELYIADSGNHRVRMVSSAGVITSIAGTGEKGFLGDGGPATAADVVPVGLAVDPRGDLYIVESGHNRVRKLASGGTIGTAAGTGEPGRLGDGDSAFEAMLDAPQDAAVDAHGNLYVADFGNRRIRKVTPDGIITTLRPGSTDEGSIPGPVGIAVDPAGGLLFTDVLDHSVRRIPFQS
jgi:DNA-binding beta-propeller fold protein YncE